MPTYDGSGSSIHPSVVDFGGLWHGYRWWFADTPYANENDQLENPSIFASNHRAVWEVPAGLINPVAPPPVGGFNSDVDLVWDPDGERLVCFWRDYVSTRTPPMLIRMKWSTDGVTWNETSDPIQLSASPWASPVVSRAGAGDWRLWFFGNNSPGTMWTATDPLGPWAFASTLDMGGRTNWHGDIIKHQGQWLGVVSDKSIGYAMASTNDGVTWNLGTSLFTSYRPTFCPSTEPGMFDIWTSVMRTQVYYHRLPESTWLDLLAP